MVNNIEGWREKQRQRSSAPQTGATTFAFASVSILLLWSTTTYHKSIIEWKFTSELLPLGRPNNSVSWPPPKKKSVCDRRWPSKFCIDHRRKKLVCVDLRRLKNGVCWPPKKTVCVVDHRRSKNGVCWPPKKQCVWTVADQKTVCWPSPTKKLK